MHFLTDEFTARLAASRLSVDPVLETLLFDDGRRAYPLEYGGTVLDVRAATAAVDRPLPGDSVRYYLSSTSKARQLFRNAGVSYVTQEGNVFLDDRAVGVYIHVEYAPARPERNTDAPTSLAFTRNDLRVLFAWITLPEPLARLPQSALAAFAGVSDAAVTRAMSKLDAEGLPRQRDYLFPEQLMRLVQIWAEEYRTRLKPSLTTHRFRAIGMASDWRQLSELPPGLVYSGVAAAAADGHDLVAGDELEVYGRLTTVIDHARDLRWVTDAEGAVHFRERFWGDLPAEWTQTGRGRPASIPLLTYADLLATGDPRAAEVAERDVLNQCLRHYRYRG